METLRALSILCNTLVGGQSTETLCGRCYRLREQHRAAQGVVWVLNHIFFWDLNHCASSYHADRLVNSRNFDRAEALKLVKEIVRK
jgi:hypothetical protein